MGFFSKLLGLGAMAGAAAGAYFVAKKYNENAQLKKETIELTTFDSDMQGEAVPDANFIEDVKKAAIEVYDEAKTTVKATAEKAGVDTDELTDAVGTAGKAFVSAGKAVADSAGKAVTKKVKSVKNSAASQAGETVEPADEIVIDVEPIAQEDEAK